MIKELLQQAMTMQASDIVVGTGRRPALKIMGSMHVLDIFPILEEGQVRTMLQALISREQDIKDFFETHDGDFGIEIQGLGRYRINALYTQDGPGFVMRPIRQSIPTFDELDVPRDQFRTLSQYPHGLVLFTGPMGSGKSSSMASVIDYINTHTQKHIVTIEDPIEYIYEHKRSVINQREIPRHSQTFQSALRGALRQAVDVVLVGEMRDLETMSLALTAAETGSLVFATLHTSGAAGAIDRIINSYPKDYQDQVRTQLSQTLRAVVWQILLPRKDGQGRIPACEILFNTHGIAHLIRKGDTHHIGSQMEISRQQGMMTMQYAIERLVEEGKVSAEVAAPYLHDIEDM